jgi:hypothetical protein
MTDILIKKSIRLSPNYLKVIEQIGSEKKITFSEVIREFMRSVIENVDFFDGEYSNGSFRRKKTIELIFCQACGNEIVNDAITVRFRDDRFVFCQTCVATNKHKEVLGRIAKTYEY